MLYFFLRASRSTIYVFIQLTVLFAILELATKWYEKNLWEGQGKEKILKYYILK